MNILRTSFLSLLLSFLSIFSVFAEPTLPSDSDIVAVSEGYIRETIPGTNISSAYMKLTNLTSGALSLSKVSSAISDRIEIHEHSMSNGMMAMRQREAIVIPANSLVTLHPGGLHFMVFDLDTPLKEGQKVLLTLHFSNGKESTVEIPVKSVKQSLPNKHKHHH